MPKADDSVAADSASAVLAWLTLLTLRWNDLVLTALMTTSWLAINDGFTKRGSRMAAFLLFAHVGGPMDEIFPAP